MFGLFKKKNTVERPDHEVFISEVDKYKSLINQIKGSQEHYVIVYHFENTAREMEQLFTAAQIKYSGFNNTSERVSIIDGHSFLTQTIPSDAKVVVVEIYPLANREEALVKKAQNDSLQIRFLTAIDSPFFKLFGGERVANLMHQLGMEPGETIKHSMVSKSISRAQDKILKKVTVEKPESRSIEQWMQVNGVVEI